MRFKANFHKAKSISLEKCQQMIEDYPERFQTPKYLTFIKTMLNDGWNVKMYIEGPSKYVFVYDGVLIFKIRFSNHKPIYTREVQNDCDFYVGISNKQVSTTDQIINQIKNIVGEKSDSDTVYKV